MAYATIIIALALYADFFEASGIVAGLFGSAYAVVRLVLVLPLGRKIDLGNSKRFLLVGLGLNVLLFAGLTLAGTIEHVIVLRGFHTVVRNSFCAHVTDDCPRGPKRRSEPTLQKLVTHDRIRRSGLSCSG
jgi:MFS family permease